MHVARVPAAGGKVERVIDGERVIENYTLGPRGQVVALESTPGRPAEVAAFEGGSPRHLTAVRS